MVQELLVIARSSVDTGAHSATNSLHRIDWPKDVKLYQSAKVHDVNALVHLETNGVKFMWTNKREGRAFMAQRLDRAICNEDWIDNWTVSSCNTLIKCFSDHFPLLITLQEHSYQYNSKIQILQGLDII
ncbi:hypothetical protein MTR_1g053180 [Medicago truncatula]|uniref:Acylamino-acid-releasing enzyme N-terminal domain-containing protein n=1 Tax=Medicago truncatula TaxID=3880 RepID=A0A072VU45_MEDTR|nr:hypothetical protein MTR_1g053180 [Medicago truncatula]